MSKARWAARSAAATLIVFVIGAFWAHYVLFGELALGRIATNIVVSAVILVLLRWSNTGSANARIDE
jgi:predicted signal transduction protein with EAL and GGDEF domain